MYLNHSTYLTFNLPSHQSDPYNLSLHAITKTGGNGPVEL